MKKEILKVIDDIVNKEYSNVSKGVDLILENKESWVFVINACRAFDSQSKSIKSKYAYEDKLLRNFFNKDVNFTKKLEKFLENNKSELELVNMFMKEGEFSKKINEANEKMNEINQINELESWSIDDLSFFGNDNYWSLNDFVKELKNFDLSKLSKEFKSNLVKQVFSANGQMEWSIDGASRVDAMNLLMPLYKSDVFKSIVDEVKKYDKGLEKYLTSNTESVIDYITSMTIHPEKIFSLGQQKKLLKGLSEVINIFNIKVFDKNIWEAQGFDEDYSLSKCKKVDENTNNFKLLIGENLIKNQVLTKKYKK